MCERCIRFVVLSVACVSLSLISAKGEGLVVSPSWEQFARDAAAGRVGRILDYSLVGYQFSNEAIPDVSRWKRIDVTDFGARPDDRKFDDPFIRRAIKAAESIEEPVVIYFPAGRYLVGDPRFKSAPFVISRSNIVLMGAGANEGGTEIYNYEYGGNSFIHRFVIRSKDDDETTLARVVEPVRKGSKSINVDDASRLEAGQFIQVFHKSGKAYDANSNGREAFSGWSLAKADLPLSSNHQIAEVSGETVTLVNPVFANLPTESGLTEIRTFEPIQNVGIENIRFSSAWEDFPVEYVHHKDHVSDYGWRGISFQRVVHSWIRNCDFKSFSQCVSFVDTMGVTVADVSFTGKKGHSTLTVHESTAVLGLRLKIETDTFHGPAVQRSASGTVFSDIIQAHQTSIDPHAHFPYATLYDCVRGGMFRQPGGSPKWQPHHGPDLLLWNFEVENRFDGSDILFWTQDRLLSYLDPLLVGVRGLPATEFRDAGLDELRDLVAYPYSLYDAQLQLRSRGFYLSSSDEIENSARLANDGNPSTDWRSDPTTGDSWLMLDFGVARSVSEVKLDSDDRYQCRVLALKEGGSDWEIVFIGDLGNDVGVLKFDSLRAVRLRVVFEDEPSGNAVVVSEVLATAE